MKVPAQLLSFLKSEKSFLIATHVSPDGDALGSSIALSLCLESIGKKTQVYDRDPAPDFYRFLPGIDRITNTLPENKSQQIPLILLDCNAPDRAGLEKMAFPYSVVIDHHETEKDFGDIRWIEPGSPATGLMVFYIIKELGIKITKEIAENLYTAITVDTGTFRYTSTTPEVLRVAAELIEAGADPALIAGNIYETWSENRLQLLLKALNTLEIHGSTAITTVTLDMLKKTGAEVSDTENFTNFPRMIKSIKVSALFREISDNYYKVSLRSKGRDINVAKTAEMFSGGGHRNAAGYKVKSDIRSAKEALLKALSQQA